MAELQWPADVVARHAITQLACLLSERPPDDTRVRSAEEWLRLAEAEERRDAEWSGE